MENKLVYTILETDLSDNESIIIGVADNVGSATRMISEYYGSDNVDFSKIRDVRDSGIEFDIPVKIDNYNYRVTCEYFNLNLI